MGKNVIISTLPNISQNYLPKVNTSNIFANSLVYDNGTNVLIGTTVPSTQYSTAYLTVGNTTAGSVNTIEVRGSQQSALALTKGLTASSTTPTVEIFNSGNFGIVSYRPGVVSSNYLMYYDSDSVSNRSLSFQTEGQNRLIINQNGTVQFTQGITGTSATFSGQVDAASFYTSDTRYVSNQIQAGYNTNAEDVDLWVNYSGYQGGTTRFRDFRIGNGKNGQIAFFDGSTSAVTFSGDVLVANSSNAQIGFNTTGALNTTGAYQYYNRSGSNKWTAGMGPLDGSDDYQIVTAGIKALNLKVSTGAATFSSSLSLGSYLTGQGTNPGGLGGSRYVIDHFNGNMRIFSYGDNTSTNGGFTFNSQRSDGTNSINFLSFATSGAATFSSSVTANGTITMNKTGGYGFLAQDDGNNTAANGAYFGFVNAAANRYFIHQLDTSNNIRYHYFNGTSWSPNIIQFTNVGAATFGSSVQLSSLVTAPSYGSGSTGLNIGYMNFQNVIGIQACYANNIYYDGANWKSISSSVPWAAAVRLQAGHIDFHTASVSSSGQTMSNWDTTDLKMRITSGGNLEFMNGSITWGYENQGIKLSKSGVGPKISLWALSQYLYLGYAETGGWERVYAQATSGGVYLTNGATSWTANSDERLKTINSGIQNAIDKILTLRAVNYSWKSDELNRKYLGLIAQDVQKVLPELVDKDEKDEINTLGIRYTEMIPVLVKAIQELKAENDQQKADIESLKALINK